MLSDASTIWNTSSAPSNAADYDGQPLEIGVKFQADVAGYITALRFYKGAANTGTHIGNLWTRTGTLLASATFTNETASGWQEVQLATPVAIQSGTTYVASYYSSTGYFAVTDGYFTSAAYNPPLRALANGQDGGNGVYKYGASGFPTLTWDANNYWVDVVFTPNATGDTTAPNLISFTVPTTATSLTVPVYTFTATDNVGVTGYLITESATAPSPSASGWAATPPTTYTVTTAGSKTLYAWAKDAAGNVSDSKSAPVTITLVDQSLYTLWSDIQVPNQAAETDGQQIEVGVKFQADIAGYITALRFYKGSANTGTHIGNLWTRTGALLASATFTNETASGWQEVRLPAPVAITANTTYVASYHSSSGYFALDEGYFTSGDYTPPLRALANGVDGGNGVYKYGLTGFPTETWNSNNYWVDVVFTGSTSSTDTTAPSVASFTMPSSSSTLTVPITAFTATDNVGVTGYLVTESAAAPSPSASGWSTTAPTSYTVTSTGSKTLYAWAKDAAGNVSVSRSATVTVSGGDTPQYSIWSAGSAPSQAAVTDGQALELGVKFQADVAGYITALRFYKGAANTGTHVGNLWSRTGALLASATFTGETASGWQEARLATPLAIEAGTTYVASYHSSSGYFAINEGYFTSSVYSPPLRALADGTDGGNGVYKYGASGFPTETWNANNYWVDVVFTASVTSDTTPPSVTAFTVPATSSSLTVPITALTASDNVGVTGYIVTESATAPSASTTGWSTTAPTSYTVTSTGSKTLYAWAKDAAGNVSVSRSATVTVSGGDTPQYSIWSAGSAPSQAAVTDGQALELGVKFQADVAGYITALRFYKGAANTGTHVGNLWSRTGALLASATFTGETASGWQEARFATPLAIEAGTTYVASYYSSSGYFAINEGYFTSSVYTPPLRALADGTDGGNGVYKYGASGFPTETWNANNYWVDVVFTASVTSDTTPPSVTAFTVPATSSSLTVPITAFTASDNVGVTGYMVTESATTPLPAATGWAAAAQTSYSFASTGSKTLYAWAKDAAGNVSPARTAPVTVTATEPTRSSIWAANAVPNQAAVTDGQQIEVGVKFQANAPGAITALRFYKGAANTGTHIGHLWSSTGTLLASATFTGETASGWQEVQLSAPVAIAAGTTYVASYNSSSGYFAIDANYFTAEVSNPPLRALANGTDGGNGVYSYGASNFPNLTTNASNYWVDVVFTTAPGDPTQPTVTAFTVPATSTSLIVPITAFAAIDDVGVTGYLVTESATVPPPTATGWSAAAPTSYAVASDGSKTLYAWAKDAAGNVSAARTATVTVTRIDTIAPTVNTFTVPASSSSLTVPITAFTATDNVLVTGYLVNEAATAPSPSATGWSATAPTSYTVTSAGTKTLYAWAKDAAGNVSAARTASVTVTATDTIPPTVTTFAVPANSYSLAFPITSFTATDNVAVTGYLVNESATAPSPSATGWSATAPTTYTTTSTGTKTLYAWAKDAAGNVSAAMSATLTVYPSDTTAPFVVFSQPLGNAQAVSTGTALGVVFSEDMAASTITGASFELRDAANTPVAATVTYDATRKMAILTPNYLLSTSTVYNAVVKGGAAGVKDSTQVPMAADYTWTFTCSASTPYDNGPGGPIVVITSASYPFSRYLTEILLAEGLNAFAVRDISTVTESVLSQYEVAILGNIPLTAAQVSMLSNWVTGGGNLIAMRPDKQLAALLGLVDTTTTLANSYLLVNTASGPGAGIVGQTIQYHGTADRYTLNGATSLATLYTDPVTATANPAVSLRSVGSNGGQAAAFAFDLSRSVVYTRQGNPAWVNQERDGVPPTRSDDLFYGAAATDPQPDWIDRNKVAIPQADEQQRLLANMIISMNNDKKPLPRFWYLPHDYEAVLLMTGDDHGDLYGNTGTASRFDGEFFASPSGCSVDNWTCLRSSSYLISDYPSEKMTNEWASTYNAEGFEISIHINTNCEAYTSSMIGTFFQNQLGQWHDKFPSLPPPASHRSHCIAWSGYTILPEEEVKHGIRLDTSYYYYPSNWAASNPGFFTGSGMPMRFADINGTTLDVYQATTQMTDESGQIYPATVDTLLGRATGPEKYYGVFTINMHTDEATTNDYTAIIASAQAHGVPVVSGRQILKWLDGRNASRFSGLTWNNNVLGFTITQAQGASGLQAMIPVPAGRQITAFTSNGIPVSYTLKTIKGINYAVFSAQTGTYAVTIP